MNILVTGANGQLGNELRRLSIGAEDRYIFTDVSEAPDVETVFLDITDPAAVSLVAESEQVDVIVNCAAYTNVDKAEDDAALADLLNCTAAKNLAQTANRLKATLIHISTDYVFPGTACCPIPVDANPAPESVYGATKLAGEKAVRESACKSIIIRTAWLYSPYGRNFVKTMRHLTEVNNSIKVVSDQVGTPTYAADLASLIIHIIETRQTDKTGIYHFTDEGVASWYDFACAIRDLSGNDCDISPCTSEEFPSKVKRPHYSVLDKSLVKSTFDFKIPFWFDSLKKCIERL